MKYWRWLLAGGVLVFCLSLSYWLVFRLKTESMAILLGVLAGSLASVPSSLLVVWLSLQRQASPTQVQAPDNSAPSLAERIVVITPTTPTVASVTPTTAPLAFNTPPVVAPVSNLPKPKITILGE